MKILSNNYKYHLLKLLSLKKNLNNTMLMILEGTFKCLDSLLLMLENKKIPRITKNINQNQNILRKKSSINLIATTLLNNKIPMQNKSISDIKNNCNIR